MRRRLLLALAALAAVFVLVAALAPLLVDVDRFRPGIESTLSGLLGRPVALGRLRLSLWTGVRVRTDHVEVGAPEGTPEEAAATLVARAVRLRPAILPLLRGTIDLRGVVADQVRIERGADPILRDGRLKARFRRTAGGDVDVAGTLRGRWEGLPGAPTGPVSLEGWKRGDVLELRSLTLDLGPTHLDARGRAEGVGTGSSRWTVQGTAGGPGSEGRGEVTLRFSPESARLDFALDFERLDFAEMAGLAGFAAAGPEEPPEPGTEEEPSVLQRLRGTGTLRAREARFAGLELQDLATGVVVEDGVVRLRQATFGFYGGRHRGDLTLNVSAEGVPFTLRSEVAGADVARLLADWSPGSAGVFRGTGAFALDVAGVAYAPSVPATLGGTMRVRVENGALTTVGLLETVAALLEAAGGRGIGRDETPFRSLAGSFAVTAGVAHTQDLAVVGDDLRLDVRGDVDLRGPLSLAGVVAFSPAVSASMVAETRALRVRQGKDGRLTVPLEIEGTLSSPQVRVDVRRIVEEGVRAETRRELERKVDETKRKLLDRLLR